MISTIQFNVLHEEYTPSTILTKSQSVVTIDKRRVEHLLFIEKNYTNIIAAGAESKIKSQEHPPIKETVLRYT